NVVTSGEPLPAPMFAKTPLIDRLVDGDPRGAALELAIEPGAKPGPHPKVRDRAVKEPDLEAITAFARNTVKTAFANFPAPLACIDAVAASVLPFEQGVAEEQRLFSELLHGT